MRTPGLAIVAVAVAAALPPTAAAAMTLRSPAFAPGGRIPARYTCDGAGRSPALRWHGVPRGTRSFALSVVDPDAPGGSFTHWLAWSIPRSARGLPAGARPPRQGRTSAGTVGYTGPCPPSGPAHRYVFRLYALRAPLRLAPGATRARFQAALRGRVRARATLVGRYGR